MLVINLILIAVLLGVGYIWSTRGFFSALLHLTCVVAAGGVAFALWEPLANAMLGSGSDWISGMAWGAGLLLPFAISAAIFTSLINLVIRGNAKCDDIINIVGGSVCGAMVGAITAGMIALSVSMVQSSGGLLSFSPITHDKSGAPFRESRLWLPVDRLVAGLYGHASQHVFSSSTPLAVYYPDLTDRGHLMKLGPDEKVLKFAARANDVALKGRYTVGETGNIDVASLLKDTFDPSRAQKLVDIDGNAITSGSYQIEGYVISAKGGLRESNGQVVFGNGFLTLVCIDESGSSQSYQPFAMISQAKGDKPQAGRWRFDGPKIFLGSVGGGAEPSMGFEFMVPKGQQPLALYIKGQRFDLSSLTDSEAKPKAAFAKYLTVRARDEAIRNGSLLSAAANAVGQELDTSKATPWKAAANAPGELTVSNSLPFSMMLQKGSTRSIVVGDGNFIEKGDAKFYLNELGGRGLEKDLRVDKFLVDATTVIVTVEVSVGKAFDLLGPVAGQAEGAPTLVDDLAQPQRHQCVGWVYTDSNQVWIRYTPGSPISDKGELPVLTKSRTDQKLALIFRCSLGVKLKYFAIGNTGVKELAPVIKLETAQGK